MAENNGCKAQVVIDRIKYDDGKDWRIVDLRPDGCDCVPLLGRCSFKSVRDGAAMHVHPGHMEITLCLKGNIRYETLGGECQILPGNILVSQPGEPHRRCNNPKGMLLYRLRVALPGKGETVLGLDTSESRMLIRRISSFPKGPVPSSARIRAAFDRLFLLYDSERRGTVMRRLKMRSAMVELLLAMIELPGLPPSPYGRENAKVQSIISRMDSCPERDYPVEELAAEAALSEVAFTDAFKRATGLTPHAYLLDIRVKRARVDLANPKLSMTAIANRYRFSSPQHFSTVFKRIVGMSPREFRSSLR